MFENLLNKLAILDGYLLVVDFLSSRSLYRSSPTAVEYLVLPLKSSNPLMFLGEPILDGDWKKLSA